MPVHSHPCGVSVTESVTCRQSLWGPGRAQVGLWEGAWMRKEDFGSARRTKRGQVLCDCKGEKRQNKRTGCKTFARSPNGSSCTCNQFSVHCITAALARSTTQRGAASTWGKGLGGGDLSRPPRAAGAAAGLPVLVGDVVGWEMSPKRYKHPGLRPRECHRGMRHRTL